ncbi:hypothetical protein DFJ74DRAFT_616721, partial [Hyaloraphidium curvatum]
MAAPTRLLRPLPAASRAFCASAASRQPKAIGDLGTKQSLFSPVELSAEDDAAPHLPPRHAWFDLASSPHPVSNIRRIRVARPPDEHPAERDWRLRREAVVEWHHNFWRDNNTDFHRAKTAFEEDHVRRLGTPPSHTAMSEFYKAYLDGARERHMEYNRRWWRENFAMLAYSWRGELRRGIRVVKRLWRQRDTDMGLVVP